MYYFCTCSTLPSPLPALDPTLQGYLVCVIATFTAKSGRFRIQTDKCGSWCCPCSITQDQVDSIIVDKVVTNLSRLSDVIFQFSVWPRSLPPTFHLWNCEVMGLAWKLFSNLGPWAVFFSSSLHSGIAPTVLQIGPGVHLVAVYMPERWNTTYWE